MKNVSAFAAVLLAFASFVSAIPAEASVNAAANDGANVSRAIHALHIRGCIMLTVRHRALQQHPQLQRQQP
jgi:hypothetical protein